METNASPSLAWRRSFAENRGLANHRPNTSDGSDVAPDGDVLTIPITATPTKRLVAYFSMEIALENAMPSYSGGLGVLAGDTIRAAADIRLPMVAISLLYRKGYFRQRLAEDGMQTEEPVEWNVEKFLKEESARVKVTLENRPVELRAWRYVAKGVRGYEVPIYFLD